MDIRQTISAGELRGSFVLMELAADWGAGLSGAVMFIGGSPTFAALAGPTLYLPALIATSSACVRFGGLTATLLPLNASTSVYVGSVY